MTLGIFPRRNLRHVDHGLEPGPPGRIGKVSRRLDDPGSDGVAEIGGGNVGRGTDRVVVLEEIADNDLRSGAAKRLGALVLLMDHRSDSVALFKKTTDCVAAGFARCTGNQEFVGHLYLQLEAACDGEIIQWWGSARRSTFDHPAGAGSDAEPPQIVGNEHLAAAVFD